MRIHVRIPIPDELVLPLSILGGLILLTAFFLFARDAIRRDRRTGMLTLAGVLLAVVFAGGIVFLFGQQVPGFEPLYESAAFVALVGIGAVACLRAGGSRRAARVIAALGALALAAKLVIEPISTVVGSGKNLRIVPTPLSHPAILLVGGTIACLAWLALRDPLARTARRREGDLARAVARGALMSLLGIGGAATLAAAGCGKQDAPKVAGLPR